MACGDCRFALHGDFDDLDCALNPVHIKVDHGHHCSNFFPSQYFDVFHFWCEHEDLVRESSKQEKEIEILKEKIEELEQKSLKPIE